MFIGAGVGGMWNRREEFACNPASMRVLKKCGFEREGLLRRSVFKDGQVIDAVLYARVR